MLPPSATWILSRRSLAPGREEEERVGLTLVPGWFGALGKLSRGILSGMNDVEWWGVPSLSIIHQSSSLGWDSLSHYLCDLPTVH